MKKNAIEIPVSLSHHSTLPSYETEGSACADLAACIDESIVLAPLQRVLVGTGIFLEIPEGYEVLIRPRSGLAYKNGITCLNTPGTIDSDYRGEIRVLLINMGEHPFTIESGMRIAQMTIQPVLRAHFIQKDQLSSTKRGTQGFGSTGIF